MIFICAIYMYHLDFMILVFVNVLLEGCDIVCRLDEEVVCRTEELKVGDYENVYVSIVHTPGCLFLQVRL